jgi:hypothetical protein
VSRNVAFLLGLLCTAIGHAADRSSYNIESTLKTFHDKVALLNDDVKKTYANKLIEDGLLKNVLCNGEFYDHISGPLAQYQNPRALVMLCLMHGDTATAHIRIFNEQRVENGTLNLSGMGWRTVRDIKKQDWFVKVKAIDLSSNLLNEIPPAFYRMFENLEKIIFTGNPITQLDTTSMPRGLEIIAEHTQLATISSTTLHSHGYLFCIAYTPLAHDAQKLEQYNSACKTPIKGLLYRCFERCCGKTEIEESHASSIITIKPLINSRTLQITR